MYFRSRGVSLGILAVTAVLSARTMLVLINDPEGPNLLVVGVMGAIVFLLSLAAYFYALTSFLGLKRVLLTILIQIIIVAGLYLVLS